MKKILLAAVIVAAFAILPSRSYAMVDFAAYGGYSFASSINAPGDPKTNGWEYGGIAHLNTMVFPLIRGGFGLFYQMSPLKVNGSKYDKNTFGLDFMLMLDVFALPVSPYVRASSSIYEETEGYVSSKQWFKSYSAGAGIDFSIMPAFRIFAEYLYTYSKQSSYTSNGNAVHAGIRIVL